MEQQKIKMVGPIGGSYSFGVSSPHGGYSGCSGNGVCVLSSNTSDGLCGVTLSLVNNNNIQMTFNNVAEIQQNFPAVFNRFNNPAKPNIGYSPDPQWEEYDLSEDQGIMNNFFPDYESAVIKTPAPDLWPSSATFDTEENLSGLTITFNTIYLS